MSRPILFPISLILLPGLPLAAAAPQLGADHLLVEGREAPAGVDVPRPRLDWQLRALDEQARGLRQSAYQIVAASSPALLEQGKGDLWDSGRVRSSQSHRIAYTGRALASSQTVYWKLRVWDQRGQRGDWSSPARFITGVLRERDWQGARWIALGGGEAQSALLRKEFAVRPGLLRATVHTSGLGHYELRINGAKAGSDILTPGWTDYRKTVLYDTQDVTALLHAGANALGVTLGNGMAQVIKTPERYNKFAGDTGGPQKALALLRLDYADGSREDIVSGDDWQARAGPLTYSNVYGGEDLDARLLEPGWDRPGFGGGWGRAADIAAPAGALTGLSGAGLPIRVIETLAARATTPLRPGVSVVDLGQNAALIPRIRVKGQAGARVRITPSELLRADGDLDDTMTGARAHWNYTLAGAAEPEQWFPQFFYRGARYLRIELFAAAEGGPLPELIDIQGDVVHADAAPTGSFASSNALFNRIYTLVRWGQRSNLMSVLTDCPQREKLGWLEQAYLNGPALRYNYGLDPLFEKIMRDMDDAQQANGLVPDIAPEYVTFDGGFRDSAEWGSAFIQVPWQQYVYTGDLELARRHYPGMKRYLAYLASHRDARGLVHIKFDLGDWYDIGPRRPGSAQLTPIDLTASAIYYDDLRIMATMAARLGKAHDARRFKADARRLKAAYTRAFFDRASGNFAAGSQTANAMSLSLGLATPGAASKLLDNIVRDVAAKGLTSGDVGYRYLLRALADGARSETIYALNNQSDKPGYGYQLKQGATSLTEAWDARRGSSQNHFMLGQINEWFFHDLAGIAPDPAAPGFRRVVIRPAVVGDATFVDASYASANGMVRSHWRRSGGELTLEVSIPPNASATIHLPAAAGASLREGGQPLARAAAVKLLGREAGGAVLAVGSGHYSFTARLP